LNVARDFFDWSQAQLATASGVGISTVASFEKGARAPIANNLSAIQRAFEDAGVVLVDERLRVGVLLRKKRT